MPAGHHYFHPLDIFMSHPFGSFQEDASNASQQIQKQQQRVADGHSHHNNYGLPKVDVVESKDKLVVLCELAGVPKDAVSVELNDNLLTIHGQVSHVDETKDEGAKFRYSERTYGDFTRTISVPRGTSSKDIEAKFDDGLLKITLPRTSPRPESAKIQIA